MFCKKAVLKNFTKFTEKHLCQNLFFNKVAGLGLLLKKEALTQAFSYEFREIFKNTFLTHRTTGLQNIGSELGVILLPSQIK